MPSVKHEGHLRLLFPVVVFITVLDRSWMVWNTMDHASDDLLIIWMAALDYARGVFHEPFFYGQDYGVMLEALLAAPFIRAGTGPVATVAVVMGLLAIAPYLAFALFHHRRGEPWPAMLFAAMPLLLPVQHGLQLTALNGIATLALVPLALICRDQATRSFWLALVLGAAVVVNPNAFLLALPIGIAHLAHGRLEHPTWWGMALGLLPVLLFWSMARDFYVGQTEGTAHTIFDWRMRFAPALIGEAMERLDAHFRWTVPFSGDTGSFGLLVLAAGCLALFRQRRHIAACATLCTLGLIAFALAFAKTHDGSDTIFYPLSRSFLALPLLIAWTWGQVNATPRYRRPLIGVLAISAMLHSGLRTVRAAPTFEAALARQHLLPIRVWPLERIKAYCGNVVELAESHHAAMIVVLRGEDAHTAHFITYGIPVFHADAPMTWLADHDRRRFQRSTRAELPFAPILIANPNTFEQERIWRLDMGARDLGSEQPRCILVQGDGGPMQDLFDELR